MHTCHTMTHISLTPRGFGAASRTERERQARTGEWHTDSAKVRTGTLTLCKFEVRTKSFERGTRHCPWREYATTVLSFSPVLDIWGV